MSNIFCTTKNTGTTMWNYPDIYEQWKTNIENIEVNNPYIQSTYPLNPPHKGISYNLSHPRIVKFSIGSTDINFLN